MSMALLALSYYVALLLWSVKKDRSEEKFFGEFGVRKKSNFFGVLSEN
jgi:hypothetical protein